MEGLIFRTSIVLFSYEIDTASITYLNAAFRHLWSRRRKTVIANPAVLLDTVHPEDIYYLVKEYHDC